MRVLVAGATGYLGKYVIKEFKKQGYWVRALARQPSKLEGLQEYIDEIFTGEVTRPETLKGVCDGIDIVFSSIGITHQKDKLTFMDVDYRGNLNLLMHARENRVRKFIYVSVLNEVLMHDLAVVRAKELFVKRLRQSGIDYTVIRPTGFFSDMLEFLKMAQDGRAFLIGDGTNKINPIHGADLAEVCVNSAESDRKEIDIGGPVIYAYNDIVRLAFESLGEQPRITRIPAGLVGLVSIFLNIFLPERIYGKMEFFTTVMINDMVGRQYGWRTLEDFFRCHAGGGVEPCDVLHSEVG